MFESNDLKHHKGRYYGLYRGYVYDNKDPKGMGRLRLCVPSILGVDDETEEPLISNWAYPKFPLAGQGWGINIVPPLKNPDGSKIMVWVEFEMGDINYPVWSGSPISTDGLHSIVGANHKKVVKGNSSDVVFGFSTPKGKVIILNDADKYILIKDDDGNSAKLESGKGITFTTKDGRKITLNDNDDSITISDATNNIIKMDPINGITFDTPKSVTIKTKDGTIVY